MIPIYYKYSTQPLNAYFQVNKSMAKEFNKHRAVLVELLCFVNVYLVNGTFERTG